ncbi:hypothetical protein DRO69_14375 [Candidatus Bathyarchaeota archaeon]|nr:MAG: hypothetical protein DRO69_14375 [Candidatus Bathyarchaeota archaeon]
MTFDNRKIGLYGTAGVLVAALIIAGIVFSGLRLPTFIPNTGTLIIKLTDAPANITHLNVTITNVSVQRVEDDTETWVDLPFVDGVSSVSLDLLELQNITKDLSVADIPSGNYTKIRLGIGEANVTYAEGGWAPVNVPSGKIDVIVRFEIEGGEVRTLLIDMWLDWIAISKSGNLRPVLKATPTIIS